MRAALFAAGAERIGDCSAARGTRPGPARTSAVRGRPRSTARPGARSGSRRSGSRPSTSRARGRCRARSGGPSVRRAGLRPLRARRPAGVTARLFTDGGARGNPGPAASAYVIEADDGTVLAAHGEAIGVATNSVVVPRPRRRARARPRSRSRRRRGGLRLGAPRQADARRVQGQERGAARALDRGSPARPGGRRRALHRRAAGHNELADRLVNEALDAAQR